MVYVDTRLFGEDIIMLCINLLHSNIQTGPESEMYIAKHHRMSIQVHCNDTNGNTEKQYWRHLSLLSNKFHYTM